MSLKKFIFAVSMGVPYLFCICSIGYIVVFFPELWAQICGGSKNAISMIINVLLCCCACASALPAFLAVFRDME